MKVKETARVVSQERIASDIYSLVLNVTFADEVRAGQFVSLFTKDPSRLLPRPISVCEADPENGTIRVVYRTVGSGTHEFSNLEAGDSIEVMGPLGNGFPVDEMRGKNVLLVGGGIGVPPMLACAKAFLGTDLRGNDGVGEDGTHVTFAVGYRSADTYLLDELRSMAPVILSTDDGSLGFHGNVVNAVRAASPAADVLFACGPKVMLHFLKLYAEEQHLPLYVSMEERMACGVGVCLGCVTPTVDVDDHSKVKNARVCTEGPVFDAEKVVL